MASPGRGPIDGYYAPQKLKLLRDFDKSFGKYGKKVLTSHYGRELAEEILRESRKEYETLIPKIPDVGGSKNIFETNLIQSAWLLALYRTMKGHGKTAEETGRLGYEMVEAQLTAIPRWMLPVLRIMLSKKYGITNMKKYASESQRRLYPEDWVWSYVEGDGKEFDSGTDMKECAIVKFLHAQGADELARYMCRVDFATSITFGMGLIRTMTLAEGDEKCDFRYKRGRDTKPGWPEPISP